MAPSSVYLFDVSFGALEMGTFVSLFLLGFASLQVLNYFRDFPEDPWYIKLMVGSIYIGDLVHSAMFMHTVHHYTIVGFFDVIVLIKTVWSLEVALVIEAFIIMVVQCYFGLRVLRVTRSTIAACIIWSLALFRASLTISITRLAIVNGTLAVVETQEFRWQAVLSLSVAAFTDVCTAAALCIGLLRSRTGFSASNKLIDRLVAFTIGSGLLTSVVSISQLITYLALSGQFVWIAFFSVLSKMFTNSLLASLNQRGQHRLVLLRIQRGRTSGNTVLSSNVTFKQPPIWSSIEMSPTTPNSMQKGKRRQEGRILVIGNPHLSSSSNDFQEE